MNKNLKNQELAKDPIASQLLATGKPFVVEMSEPKVGRDGKTYQTMFIVQQIKTNNSSINELFLGWTSNIIERCTRNLDVDIIKSNKQLANMCATGKILEWKEGDNVVPFNIQFTDSTEKSWDTQEPRKRISADGEELILCTNDDAQLPIYRTRELVLGEAFNTAIKDLVEVSSGEVFTPFAITGKEEIAA